MRTFLILVAVMTAPFAMYASGCRQDDQSAFPKGPEVKNLAAGSLEARNPTVPYIPPIDPEIAATPESTNARLLAVADRQSRLSGKYEAPGLFVLPEMSAPNAASHNSGDIMAMAAPAGQVYQTVVPIGRIEPLPEPMPPLASIMPDNQPRPEFWSRPMHVQPLPSVMPPPAGIQPMAPAGPVPGPSPFLPPAAPYAPSGPAAPDVLSMPESIPGIWLGTDFEPVAVSGPLEVRHLAGESMPPPPLSIPTASQPKPVSAIAPIAPPALVAPPAMAAPLAPPAPAESAALRPWQAFDIVPLETVKKALEPLPNLAEPDNLELPAPLPGSPSATGAVAALPSLAESLIKASESLESLRPLEEPMPAKPVMSARDMYRMDFWDDKVSALSQLELFDNDTPKSIVNYEMTQTVKESGVLTEQEIKAEQDAALAPLQKIQLRPVRAKGMDSIDAEVAPPPMVF